MPKKFKGENSKAVEARARKTAAQSAEDEEKQRRLEDELWQDDDKHALKKQQRKEEKEKKKTEQLEKKKEVQKLLDEEQTAIKGKAEVAAPVKVTRLQADAHRQAAAVASTQAVTSAVLVTDQPIEENLNRLVIEGEEARTVDEALAVLSGRGEEDMDLHPEKRMKAAYLAYEERCLPALKEENPSLRLTQLKQIIRKNWNKSPDNPLNQQAAK